MSKYDLLKKFIKHEPLSKDEYKGLLDNNILQNDKNTQYAVVKPKNLEVGIFYSKRNGNGYIIDINDNEYFVFKKNKLNAIKGDIVLFSVTEVHKKPEAIIEQIYLENNSKIIGTFEYTAGAKFGFVRCDDSEIEDIFILNEHKNNAQDRDKVIVDIIERREKGLKGKIMKVIGNVKDKGVDILSIIEKYDIEYNFNKKVLNELSLIKETIGSEEIEGRMDFRDWQVITIDGDDSKDFDDAVSIKKLDNGNFYLGVHIADVSHYVQYNTALDSEAFRRGNSIYLVDRVIPMLPEKLSNGICSLNPQVDRLVLSCLMEIDKEGQVLDYKIVEGIICSTERMTYNNVNKILTDKDEELIKKYSHIYDMLLNMEELANILIRNRKNRGCIDFDSNECKIILDENGFPCDIKQYDRNIATELIEEFMVLCNNVVATHVIKMQNIPFIYRCHDIPCAEKQEKLRRLLSIFNYSVYDFTPKSLHEILIQCEGKPEEMYINKMMLRCMEKAKYTDNNIGHYGLCLDNYSHFTSPIRRYADLQIHRIIKYLLHNQDKKAEKLSEKMPEICTHINKTEMLAVELERKVDKFKKAEYMSKRLKEEYIGRISGLTEKGIYVELDNTIEGFIYIDSITDDSFVFNEDYLQFEGVDTGHIFKMGDKVLIYVDKVNIPKGQIDFLLLDKNPQDDIVFGPSISDENKAFKVVATGQSDESLYIV